MKMMKQLKNEKLEKAASVLNEYVEWFSKNDVVRASFMDQEIRGAIMHVPIQSAAAIEGIDIDLLRKYEEERRDSGLTARLHLRDRGKQVKMKMTFRKVKMRL